MKKIKTINVHETFSTLKGIPFHHSVLLASQVGFINRKTIFNILQESKSPLSVSEIHNKLDLSKVSIQKHLKRLSSLTLIVSSKRNNTIVYKNF